jgi:hypothetical protein
VIRLPDELLKNKAMASTKLFLRNTDSATEAIEKALKKCVDDLNAEDFVFKVRVFAAAAARFCVCVCVYFSWF